MGHDGAIDIGDFDRDGQVDRVVQLAVGYAHTCVLAADDSVRCWGFNGDGELGYGSFEDIGEDQTPGEYYAEHNCGALPVFGGHGCAP